MTTEHPVQCRRAETRDFGQLRNIDRLIKVRMQVLQHPLQPWLRTHMVDNGCTFCQQLTLLVSGKTT